MDAKKPPTRRRAGHPRRAANAGRTGHLQACGVHGEPEVLRAAAAAQIDLGHPLFLSKDVAEVHDYHDVQVPILAKSLRRHMPGYRSLGFVKADGNPV